VLGLLAMLEGRRAKPAAQALAGLLDSRTLLPAAEVLMRWADMATRDRALVREREGYRAWVRKATTSASSCWLSCWLGVSASAPKLGIVAWTP
jgi:hypothetical protein